MALLRAILELKEQFGGAGRVSAIHIDHQLRGAESDADAAWCREQCSLLRVPIEVFQGSAKERAQAEGDGIEAAARSLRYELLTQAAEEAGVRYLATAHTQNDQVETILFRLLRGSGLQGLRGIPSRRPLSPVVTLVRPVLGCSREMLESYLSKLGQGYRTDSSNQELRFARNRLRQDLLPLLRANYNQDVDAALLRLATQADETQRFIEQHARALLDAAKVALRQKVGRGGELSLNLEPFTLASGLVAREALRLAWREAGLSEQAMTFAWWRELAELAQEARLEGVLNLPGKVRASTASGRLRLEWVG